MVVPAATALESLGLAVKPTLNKHPQLIVIGRITQQRLQLSCDLGRLRLKDRLRFQGCGILGGRLGFNGVLTIRLGLQDHRSRLPGTQHHSGGQGGHQAYHQ